MSIPGSSGLFGYRGGLVHLFWMDKILPAPVGRWFLPEFIGLCPPQLVEHVVHLYVTRHTSCVRTKPDAIGYRDFPRLMASQFAALQLDEIKASPPSSGLGLVPVLLALRPEGSGSNSVCEAR